jgi:hypothetical protein
MGNHDVGRALAAGAKGFWAGVGNRIVDQPEALAVLDDLANDFRGADAEFDDEFFGETPLSRLVAIAFDATPEQLADRDDPEANKDGEAWYEVQEQFSARYKFC